MLCSLLFLGLFSVIPIQLTKAVVENGSDVGPFSPLPIHLLPPHPDPESLPQRARWRFRPAYWDGRFHALSPTFSRAFFRYHVSAALVFLVPMPLLLLLLVLVLVPAPSAGVLPIRTRRSSVVAPLGFRTGRSTKWAESHRAVSWQEACPRSDLLLIRPGPAATHCPQGEGTCGGLNQC